jgi:hypothetical protein
MRGAPMAQGRIKLRYFEEILPVEFEAINKRRERIRKFRDEGTRSRIKPIRSPDEPTEHEGKGRRPSEPPFVIPPDGPSASGDPEKPDYSKTRPRPIPCDATGLAFSGGGIRSAAVCLGALQALHLHRVIDSIDYLSTVSGGGYIGSCLSAAMSARGGRAFPFGDDIFDSKAVAHLRNFSNYLLPRSHSGIRNIAEAAAIILRGLLANLFVLFAVLLGCALVTQTAYSNVAVLRMGSFVPRLIDSLLFHNNRLNYFVGAFPFSLTLWLIAVLAVVLIVWAVLRSIIRIDAYTDDTSSWLLALARFLLVAAVLVAFLDLQPILIEFLTDRYIAKDNVSWVSLAEIHKLLGGLTLYSGAISFFSSSLGRFLKNSESAKDWTTLAQRYLTHFAVFVAALVLPIVLWIAYLDLSIWSINGWNVPFLVPEEWHILQTLFGIQLSGIVQLYIVAFLVLTVVALSLQANGYSLHRFYRDRLSRAFLFVPPSSHSNDEPTPLDDLKLSDLMDCAGPYQIINAALNVEGSTEANRRGRNADFFMFTRDFVGSDLTQFGPARETIADTPDMERIDPRLDLATAMAISGAAVSANMGGSTIRLLSPTLALLNIRLGYWLRNPRDLARTVTLSRAIRNSLSLLTQKFYLFMEMFNQPDETSRDIYLTDGGHIENLGVYELLKRGCQLIVVVDGEADPSMSFPSLLKLERYARIDLGVRIVLPWDEISLMTKTVSASLQSGGPAMIHKGPHCAVGHIHYENGVKGIILYFKSSLTGDEKDYILDYKKRYPDFPHETTADQFFSEEQFEVYRALGFHAVDGFFSGADEFAWLSIGPDTWTDQVKAFAAIKAMLPSAL